MITEPRQTFFGISPAAQADILRLHFHHCAHLAIPIHEQALWPGVPSSPRPHTLTYCLELKGHLEDYTSIARKNDIPVVIRTLIGMSHPFAYNSISPYHPLGSSGSIDILDSPGPKFLVFAAAPYHGGKELVTATAWRNVTFTFVYRVEEDFYAETAVTADRVLGPETILFRDLEDTKKELQVWMRDRANKKDKVRELGMDDPMKQMKECLTKYGKLEYPERMVMELRPWTEGGMTVKEEARLLGVPWEHVAIKRAATGRFRKNQQNVEKLSGVQKVGCAASDALPADVEFYVKASVVERMNAGLKKMREQAEEDGSQATEVPAK